MPPRTKDKGRERAVEKAREEKERAVDKSREKEKPRDTQSSPRFAGIQRFVRETRSELRKVVWPTRETAINLTLIVTVVSVAVGLFLGSIDFVFKRIFELIIGG